MPVSWCNAGNGGIDIHNAADGTRINAYSGKRSVKKETGCIIISTWR